MSQKQFRMLCLFDYHSFTGFSTVSKNLVSNWKKTFGANMKLDIVGVNYYGEDFNEDENTRVISAKLKDIKKDDFGRYVFMNSLVKSDYDIIFILQDLGVVYPMISILKQLKEKKKKEGKKLFKSIFYFPVDFHLAAPLLQGLEFFDAIYTYTEYGRTNVLNIRPELRGKVKVVPHGNNMKEIYPLPENEIQAFRNEYFGSNAGKFIVGSVNRNQPRKDIPTTILGFLEYWENYNKNSMLYLHMNPEDPAGWNLRTILDQTPLKEGVDVMFPNQEDYNKGADISKLNKIYNAIDVFISTATGEGWGLTITEAMATKTPIIVPNHTSIKEIINDGERGYPLNTLYPIVALADNIIRFQSDIYEISDTIKQVYLDKTSKALDLNLKIDKAYKYVESLNWEKIAKEFSDQIKRLA